MFPTTETHSRRTSVGAVLIAAAALVFSVSAFAQHGHTPLGEEFRNPYAWPSLDSLVERSDTIVAGEVLDMRSSWSTDRREIFTTVTLRPDRRFKGGGRSLVRFRVPGGTVGDTRLTVTHSPVFAVGENALIFLAGESGRLPRVVAGEAGKAPHPDRSGRGADDSARVRRVGWRRRRDHRNRHPRRSGGHHAGAPRGGAVAVAVPWCMGPSHGSRPLHRAPDHWLPVAGAVLLLAAAGCGGSPTTPGNFGMTDAPNNMPEVVQPTDDHGDTQGSATQVEPGSSTTGALENAGDVDFFRIELGSGTGVLSVGTTGTTDTLGTLILPDGTTREEDNWEDHNFRIAAEIVTAGTYFVAVRGSCAGYYVEGCATGAYVLDVASASDDHGDTRETATTVPINSSFEGLLHGSNDIGRLSSRSSHRGEVPHGKDDGIHGYRRNASATRWVRP